MLAVEGRIQEKMKKSKVDGYLGKYVEVTLVDDFVYRGIFKKTDDDFQRYYKNNYYYCDNYGYSNTIFRSSHIKKIKEEKEDGAKI